MPATPIPARTLLKLLLTMFFWGGTFVAARWAVREAPPFFVASCRYAVATLVLFGLVAWTSRADGKGGPFPVPRGMRQWAGLFSLGVTGIFLYNALFFTGLQWTTAGNGSLIVAINPMLTALLSAAWLRERIRPLQAAGFAVSFAGVATVISRGSWAVLRGLSFNPGDVLLLGAPLAWAVYSVFGKKVLREFSPLAATAYASLFGTMLLVPCALLEAVRTPGPERLSRSGWLAVLHLALLGTVVGFVWWYEGIREIGAGRSAAFVNLVPLFGILLASVVLGETIVWPQVVGGALVIGGVWLGAAPGTRSC